MLIELANTPVRFPAWFVVFLCSAGLFNGVSILGLSWWTLLSLAIGVVLFVVIQRWDKRTPA